MATNVDFIVKNGLKAGVNTGVNINGSAPAGSLVVDANGQVGIGVTPTSTIRSYAVFSGNSTASSEYTSYSYMNAGPTSGSTSKYGGAFVGAAITGLNHTGTVGGVQGAATIQNAGTTTGRLVAMSGVISTAAAGTVTDITCAFGASLSNTGSSTFSGPLCSFYAPDHTVSSTGVNAAYFGGYGAAAGKWNLYMSGTAQNALAGNTRIGSTAAPTVALDVTGSLIVSGTITGSLTGAASLNVLKSGDTMTGTLQMSSTAPNIRFTETDQGADLKDWFMGIDAGTFQLQTRTDAYSYLTVPLSLTRAGVLSLVGTQTNSYRYSTDASPYYSAFLKARGTAAAPTTVVDSDDIGEQQFYGHDGTANRLAASIVVEVEGTPATTTVPGRIIFRTTPAGSAQTPIERMRVDSSGNLLLNLTPARAIYYSATVQNSQLQIASTSSLSGISIIRDSASSAANTLSLGKTRGTLGTFTAVIGNDDLGAINFAGADGTTIIQGAAILASVDGTVATDAMPGRLQFLTTPTGSKTALERMRITSAGNIGIGITPAVGRTFTVAKTITGSTTSSGVLSSGTVQSDVTAVAFGYQSQVGTQATAFSLNALAQYGAYQGTIGAGSSVGFNYGFYADSTLIGGTNNYGFYGNIAAATGRWNLYMAGTAQNYILGNVGIGSGKTVPATALDVNGTVTATAFSGPLTGTVTGAASLNVLKAGDTMSGDLNITKASGTPKLAIQSAQAAGFAPAQIQLWRYGAGGTATPNAQTLGELRFDGLNTAAAYSNVGMISVISGTNTATGTPGSMIFNTSDGTTASAATRMTIGATGNVGIGNNAPAVILDVRGTQANFARFSTDAAPFYEATLKYRGTAGAPTTVASQDVISSKQFYAYDGIADRQAASIDVVVSATPANSTVSGYLAFSTTPTGTSQVPIERMRIGSGGNVGIGAPGLGSGQIFEITKNQNAGTVAVVRNTDAGSSAQAILQLTGAAKYVNFTLDPTSSYLMIAGAGGTVTKYERFDSYIWQSVGGTTVALLDSVANFTVRNKITARTATSTDGFMNMAPGGPAASGYLEFNAFTSGTRQGYIGFSNTNAASDAGTLKYVAGTHEFTGAITVATSGSSGSVHITDTGAGGANIRLTGNGATTPSKYIRAAGGVFQILNNAYTTAILEVSDAGAVSAVSFNATSTERVKDAITDLSDSYLAKFADLRPREYDRRDYSAHEFGFIAEEMAEVYPEVVGRDSDGKPSGIDYGKLSTILTAKVQEQQSVIEQLQSQMARVMELLKGSF